MEPYYDGASGFSMGNRSLLIFFEMNVIRIPLLCKERLGEVESWYHWATMRVAAMECCEEPTSPPPLLTKEGDARTFSHTFYPC